MGLFARLFSPKTALNAQKKPITDASLRKCKGCSFYYGPATLTTIGKKATAAVGENATSTAIGKKAGPSIVKSDSVTQQVATNAVAGHGNTATQTATTQQAKDWRAVLAGPVGQVGAVALVLAGGYGLYLLLPLLPKRRKDPIA